MKYIDARQFRYALSRMKFTKEQLKTECLLAYHFTCPYCEREGTKAKGPDGYAWHLDRYYPPIHGGDYTVDNVILSCAACNVRKSNQHPCEDPAWDAQITLDGRFFMAQVFTFVELPAPC